MRRSAALLCLLALGLAACGSTNQAVTGVLVEEGGPSSGLHTLVPGYIKLSSAHTTYLVVAGHHGGFSVPVVPGTYRIVGRPANLAGVFAYPCGGQRVIVKAGINVKTTVTCEFP